MNIQQQNTSEVADTETVVAYNEDLDPPPPQDVSNVFSASDLSSHSSYGSAKYNQQSSRSSQNTTHELQDSSIPGRTLPDLSNTMPPPFTKNGSLNIYVCMVRVSKLTPSQQLQHAVMLLQPYHELCNTNYPSSMFVSPPPIPII